MFFQVMGLKLRNGDVWASTIDNVFHTNSAAASEDITGENLDRLVSQLRDVKLIVIDEISTVGAAEFFDYQPTFGTSQ